MGGRVSKVGSKNEGGRRRIDGAASAVGRRGVDDGRPGRARAIEARTRSEGEREEEQGRGN